MNLRIARRNAGIGGLAFAVGLVGCDAVLGLHRTLDEDWDGGVVGTAVGTSTSASTQSGNSYSNPLTTGDGAVPTPTDAGNVAHWADWPIPNPPRSGLPHPQVYDTSTAGIVRDTVTNLQWQVPSQAVPYTWNDAVAYCAALTDANGGWRLPSRVELFSIIDYTVTPAINTTSFGTLPTTDAGSSVFWSASLKAGDNTQAWAVDFGASVDLVVPKSIATALLVRCVRGGS